MKLSVIIPVLNHAATLPDVLSFVVRFADETILVDRGSTDDCRMWFERYSRLFPMKWVETSSAAMSISEQMTGDWTLLLGANELPDPRMLAEIDSWKRNTEVSQYTFTTSTKHRQLPEVLRMWRKQPVPQPAVWNTGVTIQTLESGVIQVPAIHLVTPRQITAGQQFHVQQNGKSAIWVDTSHASQHAQLLFDGFPLDTTFGHDRALSAIMPAGLLQDKGVHLIHILDTESYAVSNSFPFTID